MCCVTLKNARKQLNLTQEQLSLKSGVKLTTLQKLEHGTNNINAASVETVIRLSRALGVGIEDLVHID